MTQTITSTIVKAKFGFTDRRIFGLHLVFDHAMASYAAFVWDEDPERAEEMVERSAESVRMIIKLLDDAMEKTIDGLVGECVDLVFESDLPSARLIEWRIV